jgi:hypothetical protein
VLKIFIKSLNEIFGVFVVVDAVIWCFSMVPVGI